MEHKSVIVYQLKIVLCETRPQIWRRVQVPADIRLGELHLVLQAAMGWMNSHLHSFAFGDKEYSASYEEGDLEELRMENERTVRLCEVFGGLKSTFAYVYDFGDNWEHIVTVEKALYAVPGVKYPLCVGGARACPPEDCGGTGGYRDLLKVLRNPSHPDYKDMKTWLGRRFDPEAYDPEQFGKELRRLRRYA